MKDGIFHSLIRCVLSNNRGSISMLFGMALVPILAVAGVALDYSRGSDARARLQAATDAAAIAAAKAETRDKAEADMLMFTKAYAFNVKGVKDVRPVLVTYAAGSAQVKMTGTLDASLLKILGITSQTIETRATAGAPAGMSGSGKNSVVYFALDMSASMLIPATYAERTRLEALTKPYIAASGYAADTPQGCQFACHQREGWEPAGGTAYDLARANSIVLREDVMNAAVTDFINRYIDAGPGTNRVSVIGFSNHAEMMIGPTGSKITAISALKTFPSIKSNETIYEVALPEIKAMLGPQGTGTAASPEKTLILITDGLRSNRDILGTQQPIDTRLCQSIKDAGIKLGVMEIEYLSAPENKYFNIEVAPVYSQISPKMKACASDGLYFKAGFGETMTDKFAALLDVVGKSGSGALRLTK